MHCFWSTGTLCCSRETFCTLTLPYIYKGRVAPGITRELNGDENRILLVLEYLFRSEAVRNKGYFGQPPQDDIQYAIID